jgi:AraC-like DNA-binding protein
VELVPAVILAGAINAALLSAVTAFAARREPAAAWLSADLALLAIAVTAIFVTHETDGVDERIAVAVETVATLASGPALYHYIRSGLRLPVRARPTLLHFAPAILALAAAPVIALGWSEPPAPLALCLYQAGYTLAAAATFVRKRAPGDRSWHGRALPLGALAIMGAVHTGQLARFTGIAGSGDANIVPLLGALGALVMLVLVLSVQQTTARVTAARYAKSTLGRDRLETILGQLQAALEADNFYRRPDLGFAQLTAAAGVSAHHASQALSEVGQTTFGELLARRRVAEAKRLLSLPENATVAVEPLGMEAGFRSRSAFYAAFSAETGLTPAQYRRRTVSSPTGTDTETAARSNSRR